MQRQSTSVKGVVSTIVKKSRNGPYATAKVSGIKGSITFSLLPDVWVEEQWPTPGTSVCLGRLEQRRAGWRAGFGRLWQLSDEADVEHQAADKIGKE